MDPCLAKEIAIAERDRIMYEKMKAQSDKLLKNLNIRTSKYRVRGPAVPVEEDVCDDVYSDHEACSLVAMPIAKMAPAAFHPFASANNDKKIFTFAAPCDCDTVSQPDIIPRAQGEFEKLHQDLAQVNKDVLFSILSKPVCVCGKCGDPETRLVGSLRSVAMILKSTPSVIVTRNGGGLIGIWTPSDGPMESFVKKHL